MAARAQLGGMAAIGTIKVTHRLEKRTTGPRFDDIREDAMVVAGWPDGEPEEECETLRPQVAKFSSGGEEGEENRRLTSRA